MIENTLKYYSFFFIFLKFSQAKNMKLSKHSLWGVIHLRLVNVTRIVAIYHLNGCRPYIQLLKTVKKL